jgi:hypothetical protein
MKKYLLIILLFVFSPVLIFAQCCGGMGTMGARIGLGFAEAGSFQMQIDYDMNNLNSMFDGSSKVDNAGRQRIIHAAVLEANYGITRTLAATAILTYMVQEIASPRDDGTRQVDHISGLGDMILMAKYRLMNPLAWNGWGIYGGLGAKLPTGKFNYTSYGDSILAMDLQPGTGSFDAITWLSLSRSHFFNPNLHFNSGATFRLPGKNSGFKDTIDYRFGNDFQYSAGLNYSITGKLTVDIFNYFRYRYQHHDTSDGNTVAKTGGHWIYTSPGFKVNITDNFAFIASAELPLYRNINGPQLTSTSRFTAGLVYKFSTDKVTVTDTGQ